MFGQRKPGQRGNTTPGHAQNRASSAKRGGNHNRGGAGHGETAKTGCPLSVIGFLLVVGGAGTAIWHLYHTLV